jgi:UDP-N-acetylglucosamine diphosphorylase/glucosamine-1-phosphate N-acetyltransferase
MRVCLFEDPEVADLEPLTLTRPVFDLLCGQTSLGAKQCRFFAARERAVLVRPHLAEMVRLTRPADLAVNDRAWLGAGPVVLVNGRWLPPAPPAAPLDLKAPCVGLAGGEVAFVVLGPEESARCCPLPPEECRRTWQVLPQVPAGGRLLRHLWEVVDENAGQITLDWRLGTGGAGDPGERLAVVGPRAWLVVDPTARVEPFVVADTRGGPVVIDREATVTAFSRLEGPCYIGPGTQVHGAKIRAGTTLGPQCRIGGEVEASIVQGHSNKYHDGFLGHAYVGEWVNLGAGTQNSDLRNDYGEVRVTVNGRLVRTGRSKVGCYLGDHTKTGLGALLNTGTNAGAFCNLLPGGGLLPRHIPSFGIWSSGRLAENADLPGLLETAARVMSRRGQELTETHAALYRAVFEQTASARQALREGGQRRLRRSA